MKGNNGTGNNEAKDEWKTPDNLFNELDNQYNFTFDCCASMENKKCESFTDDFLDLIDGTGDVLDMCWMNPPFSKAIHMFDKFFKVVKKGVAIYRADNFESKIWQNIIFPNADWIFIPNKRISYNGLKGGGVRFPSALIGKGVNVPEGLDGTVLLIKLRSQLEQ